MQMGWGKMSEGKHNHLVDSIGLQAHSVHAHRDAPDPLSHQERYANKNEK